MSFKKSIIEKKEIEIVGVFLSISGIESNWEALFFRF